MPDHEEIKSTKEIIAERKDGRANNGRPKGSMNKATMEMKEARKAFTERVNKNVDKLFNAQMSLAMGNQMLFVIHTDSKGVRRKPEMVTDVEIISRFLDENDGVDGTMEIGNHAKNSKVQDYFFLTTTPPNNQAIESLLNRSFGKAKESLDLTSGDEPIRGATIVFADHPTPTDTSTDVS